MISFLLLCIAQIVLYQWLLKERLQSQFLEQKYTFLILCSCRPASNFTQIISHADMQGGTQNQMILVQSAFGNRTSPVLIALLTILQLLYS